MSTVFNMRNNLWYMQQQKQSKESRSDASLHCQQEHVRARDSHAQKVDQAVIDAGRQQKDWRQLEPPAQHILHLLAGCRPQTEQLLVTISRYLPLESGTQSLHCGQSCPSTKFA